VIRHLFWKTWEKILVLERVVQEQKKKLGVLGSSLEKLGNRQ
jgi:hypothetical protein